MNLTDENVKDILDASRDIDDLNIDCACSLLNLLVIIESDIDKLSETYTTMIIKNNIPEKIADYFNNRIESIGDQLENMYKLNTIIKLMHPDADFGLVDMKIQFINGKYEMFKNIVDNINNTDTSDVSDAIDIDIVI